MRRAWMLLGMMSVWLPATAFAGPLGTQGMTADGARLFWTTVMALLLVAVGGVLSFGAFQLARLLRLFSRERELQIYRSLQVLFGALVLFATILPYVMLNFSLTLTLPILGAGVFVIFAGLWGQGASSTVEPPTSPQA